MRASALSDGDGFGIFEGMKRVSNGVGLRVFGRRMGNDDYISISCGPRCVGQLEAEPLVGVKDRWIYRFVPEGTPDLPFAGSRRRSGHLAARKLSRAEVASYHREDKVWRFEFTYIFTPYPVIPKL